MPTAAEALECFVYFVGACFTNTASCMTKMMWVKAMTVLGDVVIGESLSLF